MWKDPKKTIKNRHNTTFRALFLLFAPFLGVFFGTNVSAQSLGAWCGWTSTEKRILELATRLKVSGAIKSQGTPTSAELTDSDEDKGTCRYIIANQNRAEFGKFEAKIDVVKDKIVVTKLTPIIDNNSNTQAGIKSTQNPDTMVQNTNPLSGQSDNLRERFIESNNTTGSGEQAEAIKVANRKIIESIDMKYEQYLKREKTILEQVLNYTTTGSLEGETSSENIEIPNDMSAKIIFGNNRTPLNLIQREFWVSGEHGEDKCVMTLYRYSKINDEVINYIADDYGLKQFRLGMNLIVHALNPNYDAYNKQLRSIDNIAFLGQNDLSPMLFGKKVQSPNEESRRPLNTPIKLDLRYPYAVGRLALIF